MATGTIQIPTMTPEQERSLKRALATSIKAKNDSARYAMEAGVDPEAETSEGGTESAGEGKASLVRDGFDSGHWSLEQVKAACIQYLWITPEQYTEITGETLTDEETAAYTLAAAKEERTETVAKIVVTVDGMMFDGDETSQNRMARTIVAAIALGADLATETRLWVLADNVVAYPTIKQLAQALKLAGDGQTEVWTAPYDTEDESTDETEDTGADTTVTE